MTIYNKYTHYLANIQIENSFFSGKTEVWMIHPTLQIFNQANCPSLKHHLKQLIWVDATKNLLFKLLVLSKIVQAFKFQFNARIRKFWNCKFELN